MGDYPRIKCNVAATGERIYHLPFDEQYDRMVIRKPGECYAARRPTPKPSGFGGRADGTGRKGAGDGADRAGQAS